MGTRGYRVYRHKGYYHVRYNHYDSYPDGLGVQVAAEVPRNAEEYKEWLQNLRQALDSDFEENKDQIDVYDGGGEYFITKDRPTNDIMIEWVYEIDLDHEVFLVDSNPLFALNNMPPSSELFVEWIGVDSYGHRGFDPTMPKEHIYNWKAAPPKVDDSVIADYAARGPSPGNYSTVSELLGTTGSIGSCEAARIALYEVIVGRMMQVWEIGHNIRVLETIPDGADISGELLSLGVDMVQITIGRMLFGKKQVKCATPSKGLTFSWLATDICLRITTHLDDERNLKKSILELVDEIALNRQPDIVAYGVLFSFFHCVIVRVDMNNEFKATAALQFLPSFYATSPSTPGITAIGRLAYHCLDTTAKLNSAVDALQEDHFLNQVPLDVLELIAGHLNPSDLLHLCAATSLFEPAAESVLRFPHIEDYRIIGLLEEGGKKRRKNLNGIDWNQLSLTSQVFSTMVQSSLGPVLVVGELGTDLFGVSLGSYAVIHVQWKVEDRDV
ncbi:polymerase II transcription elongation factor [Mycena venus]|uniref:Polymerase II transcription elongation factor n=1 Tax=Mycena venus TaxID=2733690 RepID=A0A8H6YNW2_9AGAR|nr:polymerase II transcription elongation factor [Mycena venus]